MAAVSEVGTLLPARRIPTIIDPMTRSDSRLPPWDFSTALYYQRRGLRTGLAAFGGERSATGALGRSSGSGSPPVAAARRRATSWPRRTRQVDASLMGPQSAAPGEAARTSLTISARSTWGSPTASHDSLACRAKAAVPGNSSSCGREISWPTTSEVQPSPGPLCARVCALSRPDPRGLIESAWLARRLLGLELNEWDQGRWRYASPAQAPFPSVAAPLLRCTTETIQGMVLEAKAATDRYGDASRVAPKLGIERETLRHSVVRVKGNEGLRPGVSTKEKPRVAELEREVKERQRASGLLDVQVCPPPLGG